MSMMNLHKIYEPPIPKHLIPTNNPFYNKQIFSPPASESLALHFQKRPYLVGTGEGSALLQSHQ
jgi:hypothetical protein